MIGIQSISDARWRNGFFNSTLIQTHQLRSPLLAFNPSLSIPMGFSSIKTLFLFCFLSIFATRSTSRIIPSDSESHKVSLDLYYESLCPDSVDFILDHLAKIFDDDDLVSIIDLNLVPWGNAKLRSNGTIVCQHGEYECLLNTVEACAINIWPELSEHFPFIYCVETLVRQHKHKEWGSCFEKLGLDSKPIEQCYNSDHGKELELHYAAETDALLPPHTYVPWVVVDGEPLYEDCENFLSYVCKAYKGTNVPQSCAQAYINAIRKGKEKPKHSVCNMERLMPTWEQVRSTITSWIQQLNLVVAN